MAKRGIAHVPEGRGTFATMSVIDNLRLGAWVQRGPTTRELARVFDEQASDWRCGHQVQLLRAVRVRLTLNLGLLQCAFA